MSMIPRFFVSPRAAIGVGTTVAAIVVIVAGIDQRALEAQRPDRRIVVVTLDGVRWQEIFGGAARGLITGDSGGVRDTALTLSRYWRQRPEERREALLPFFWRTIAREGQIWGDSTEGSTVRVTNGKRFSYPGYNELFSGAPDDRIDSNDKIPNPNRTVFESLAALPGFRGRIELFGSWDVFPFIFNVERSRLSLNGDGLPFPHPTGPEQLANLMTEALPSLWAGSRLDAITMVAARRALEIRHPKVLVVLLGETDEWAHDRRYDQYLDAAHRADRFIGDLWARVQALPDYRGRTSLLIATDHGRGSGRDWSDHGREVAAAERIWMAVMGPDVPRLGVRREVSATQSQFAATIASLLGERWSVGRALSLTREGAGKSGS
jgi:Type I phosphodiesterase / nucleotide pyrophosphatase